MLETPAEESGSVSASDASRGVRSRGHRQAFRTVVLRPAGLYATLFPLVRSGVKNAEENGIKYHERQVHADLCIRALS